MSSIVPGFRGFILGMGWGCIAVALLVLSGWQFGIEALQSLLPGISPMNPVTAVSFILSGSWIILYLEGHKRFGYILASLVTLIGLIHFVTSIFPYPAIRLDQLLYPNLIRNSAVPNLIAPNTALNFLLCGLAMLLTGRDGKPTQFIRQALLLLSFLLAYTSLLGYVFNIQPEHRLGGLTPMALMTTLNFLLAITGVLLADTRFGVMRHFSSPLSGGRLMRRFIPLILIFPPVVNYFALLGAQNGWYSDEFGIELSTFIYTILLLLFISFYAAVSNRLNRKEKEQDQRFASLVESINDGILETDSEGRIIYVNGATEKILGFRSAEVLGISAIELLVPGKDKASFEERLEKRKSGVEESFVIELVDKSGRKKQVAMNAKPLYGSEGRFKSILVTMRDISEDLRNLQDIKTFTDFAAHDLKAPLVNMTMLVELAKSSQPNPDQLQILDMMTATADKMRMLVDDLLQFSRIGATELQREHVDTAALVRDLLDSLDTGSHRVQVGDLPGISANPASARQLFLNLLSNALKYSSRSVQPEVIVDSRVVAGRTWFDITDNGVGIDPRFLDQLFQPFKRFSSQFKGNGLGLAIVKRIVEKHGGQIEASLPGSGGMRFSFTLDPERPTL